MDESCKKTDRRIIKTKRAIYSAMIKLMAEKEINDISVKDLANVADINRKTFYNYYSGIYQLVDEVENSIVEYFGEKIESLDFKKVIADPSILFSKLYETLNRHIEIIDAIFCSKGNSSLIDKVINKLIEKTRDAAVRQFNSDPSRTETVIRFIFAGEIAVYQRWYHSDRSMTINELSRTIESICKSGLNSLISN